jgi:hypothetical protein
MHLYMSQGIGKTLQNIEPNIFSIGFSSLKPLFLKNIFCLDHEFFLIDTSTAQGN